MWKDKCPVLLISTHAMPIEYPCVPRDEVPRCNGAIRESIETSPMLHEYTTYMREVDVANNLWLPISLKLVATSGGTAYSGFLLI